MEEVVVLLDSEGGALGLQKVQIAFQAEEMARTRYRRLQKFKALKCIT